MKNHTKITAEERDKIAVWLAGKVGLREIGRRLGRGVSSISDEVKRNSKDGIYTAISAQYLSDVRASSGRSQNSRKARWIYNHIENKLREGWTPEQIAGRLKRDYRKKVVCHETIYRYIYCLENVDKNLKEYLVRHHRYRSRKRYNWLPYRGIQGRVSIHDRPDSINNKQVFGHWETDVVEGRNHSGGIQTVLERKTRYYTGKLIANIDSINGFKAQSEILTKYPENARLSVTMDNGRENYDHRKLNELGINTYFCDPYCSWQKGSNENHNGILRRYIPKKTDLKTLSQGELNLILDDINSKPRKCLNYETAKEAFTRELNDIKFKCSDSQ